MTIGEALNFFIEKYRYAVLHDYIKKPLSWALYQTWKYCDEKE